jgi:hypothetical protein
MTNHDEAVKAREELTRLGQEQQPECYAAGDELVERLQENIISDAFAEGIISSGILAEQLIRERGEAANAVATLKAQVDASQEALSEKLEQLYKATTRAEAAEAENVKLREALVYIASRSSFGWAKKTARAALSEHRRTPDDQKTGGGVW